MRSTTSRVWKVPIILAVLTMLGLLSALLGEPLVWKALAWVLLSVPVGVALWYAQKR